MLSIDINVRVAYGVQISDSTTTVGVSYRNQSQIGLLLSGDTCYLVLLIN
jgi:hypothetical protein